MRKRKCAPFVNVCVRSSNIRYSKNRIKRKAEIVGDDKISAGVHFERCTPTYRFVLKKSIKFQICFPHFSKWRFSLEIQAFPPFVFFSVSTGMIRAALSYVDSSANSQRTVTRFPPPMVQVNRVRSQSPLVISSIAVGIKVSSSTTS